MPKVNKVAVSLNDSLSLRDTLTVPTERKFKDTGQMIAPCTIARVGVMEYLAKDCGDLFSDREPNSIVKVMTTEAALFDTATIESARSAPVTIGHPAEDVTVHNAKDLMKGTLEGLPTRLDDSLSATVVLNDADAISIVQEQADELSIGQTCDLVLADEASEWDAEKINIRINHVAIVSKGRAGSARINDGVMMFDQAHVDGLTAKLDASEVKVTALKDENIALQVKVDETTVALKEAKAVAFNDAVEARIELITQARLLDSGLVSKGKSDFEIRLAAVTKSYQGKKKLEDQSEAYIEALFDMAIDDHSEEHGTSDLQQALNDGLKQPVHKQAQVKPQYSARARMIARNEGKH